MRLTSQPYRNFANIRRHGNSARVLNLLDPTLRIADSGTSDNDSYFFNAHALNRVFILKHRLRPQEMTIFQGRRTIGTKIFVPFDATDLRQGGKYLFVGERGAEELYHRHFGVEGQSSFQSFQDIRLLNIIDDLPSLDPFIMRERLKMYGFRPHPSYFEISEAEFNMIQERVEIEFAPLISRAFGAQNLGGKLSVFVRKLWNADDSDEMLPLLRIMRIRENEYPETIFAWKGFIYYKSLVGRIGDDFMALVQAIKAVHVPGLGSSPHHRLVMSLRDAVIRGLREEMASTAAGLRDYELAYFDGLVRATEPSRFIEFLSSAPERFQQLGASLGAIRHATAYWQYRVDRYDRAECDVMEFLEILRDFIQGLMVSNEDDVSCLVHEAAGIGK